MPPPADPARRPEPDPAAERRRALALLREGRSFLLVGHERPDGDCVGGQAALARVLAALGKRVAVVNPDPPPAALRELVAAGPFAVWEGGPLPEHDVCVLLDFNVLSRTGPMAAPIAAAPSRKLVVDHHVAAEEPWWDAAYVDVSASATGLLVRRIARELDVPLDPVSAHAVFTSLATDTGWFRYSNTDAETLETAAELVRHGVRPADLYRTIHQRSAAEQPLGIGAALGRTEYHLGGRLAVVVLPLEAGAPALEDTDVVLDVLRAVDAVEVVLLVREREPGEWKLSARSKTDADVNRLASRFGGGGHAKASGATLRGGAEDVRARLVAAAADALGDGAAPGAGA